MAERNGRRAFIVVDLGYGDAGKGSIVDHLCRMKRAHTVIRFNGGAQAAHNVVTADGRHHTFAQFGSGMFVPGVRTHLTQYFVLNPAAMLAEEEHLRRKGVMDAFDRTTIDEHALVITPFQRAANRLRELARGDARHGSCGLGIGETVADALAVGDDAVRVRDLRDPSTALSKLVWMQERKRVELLPEIRACAKLDLAAEEIACLTDRAMCAKAADLYAAFSRVATFADDTDLAAVLHRTGNVVFEGAQGVLIDEWWGFHPYTTWSTCTFANALQDLEELGYDGEVVRLGVLRAYGVRHGPGPFVSEDAGLSARIPDDHNGTNDWQREFRIGWFDAVAARYALEVCGGADALAVTCFDRLAGLPEWRSCVAYEGRSDGGMFQRGADGIVRIVPGPSRDLRYQEELGRRLALLRPVLRTTASAADPLERAAEHLQYIATATGVPTAISSFGPTSDDKRYGSFTP